MDARGTDLKPDGRDVLAWVAPIVAVVIALWMCAHVWGARLPNGDDVTGHMVRTQHGLSHVLRHGHLDGWLPRFGVGSPQFLFYGPGFTVMIGLLRVLSFGLLSQAGAMKVMAIGTFVAFPLAFRFLARSLGLSPAAAGLASVLVLAVNVAFGLGLSAVFRIGLIPNQFGMCLLCIALGAALRLVAEPSRRWFVVLTATLTLLIVSHLHSVVIGGILFLLAVPAASLGRARARDLLRIVPPALLAAAVAAFWVVPFLAHMDLHGPPVLWGTPSIGNRLSAIWDGRLVFRPHIAPFIVLSAVAAVALQRTRRWSLLCLVIPAVFIVVTRVLAAQFPHNGVFLNLENRSLGLLAALTLLPLAALLAQAVEGTRAVALAALVAAAALVVVPLGSLRSDIRQSPDATAEAHDAARALRRLVPVSARFATELNWPAIYDRTGVLTPDRWLAWYSGRSTLNVFNAESSSSDTPQFYPDRIKSDPAPFVAKYLSRYGVTHVVVVSDETRARFMQEDKRFRLAWDSPRLAIFAVVPSPGRPRPASLVSTTGEADARMTKYAPEHLVIRTEAPAATPATIAIAHSPKWHAHIDGRSLALGHDGEGLMTFALPAGSHRLRFDYENDRWDRLGWSVSAITLVAIGVHLVRWRVRRAASS